MNGSFSDKLWLLKQYDMSPQSLLSTLVTISAAIKKNTGSASNFLTLMLYTLFERCDAKWLNVCF